MYIYIYIFIMVTLWQITVAILSYNLPITSSVDHWFYHSLVQHTYSSHIYVYTVCTNFIY